MADSRSVDQPRKHLLARDPRVWELELLTVAWKAGAIGHDS